MSEKKITKKEQARINNSPIDMYNDDSMCRRCLKLLGDTMEYNCKPGEVVKPIRKNNIKLYVVLDGIPKDKYDFLSLERGLEKLCDQTKLKMSEIYVDYSVRCSLHKNIWGFSTVQRKSIVHKCRVYINGEISRLKPDVVLLMGEISLQSILKQSQVKFWHNRLIKHRELKSYVIPVALNRNKLILNDDVLKTISGALKKPITFKKYKTQFVRTEAQLKLLVSKLKTAKTYAVDTETSSLDKYEPNAYIFGISISINGKVGYFVPIKKLAENYETLAIKESKWVLEKTYWSKSVFSGFKKQLERKDITLIMHNAGFDWNYLVYSGFNLRATLYDTIIGSSVLYDFQNGLKPLSWIHTDFGGFDDELDEILPNKKLGYHTVDPVVMSDYACFDAIATKIEYDNQVKILKKHPVKDHLPELMQLRINLSNMELGGCRININTAKKLQKKFEVLLADAHRDLCILFDMEDINLNSNPQLMFALYRDGKSSLSYFANKAKKKPSTDKKLLKFLLPMIRKHPVKTKKEQKKRDNLVESIELLSDYRRYSKYLSTYIKPFIERSVGEYYHPYFKVHSVVTGRLASNVQQTPREGGIRDCIVPDVGCDLVELDYSQAEMRVAAELSRDEKLLAILNDRSRDIHGEIGHEGIRKPDGSQYDVIDFKEGEISEKIRPPAKILGFSILYGKTEKGLSEDLNCTPAEARKVIQFLLDGFPGLKALIEKLQLHVEEFGYIDTIFGRRLYIPEGLSDDPYTRSEAHRFAVNYPVQSTSADILYPAINRIEHRIIKEKWRPETRAILTVHDSILYQTHKSQTKDFVTMARAEMERPIPQLKHVKMFADAKVGKFWGAGMKGVK